MDEKEFRKMSTLGLGTIEDKPIDQEMLDALAADFARDWDDSEAMIVPTSRGITLRALQALELPVDQIEALERRAQNKHQPLSIFIRTVLQDELSA
jgi:hypothetical protein